MCISYMQHIDMSWTKSNENIKMHCSGFNFIKLVNKSIYFQSLSDKKEILTWIIRIEIIILVITLPFYIYFLSFSFAWISKDAIRMRDATPIQIVTSIFHCCCDILAACVILMVPISCLKVFLLRQINHILGWHLESFIP